jgi:hypothetical protein
VIILPLLPFFNPYWQGFTALQVPVPAIRDYYLQLLNGY